MNLHFDKQPVDYDTLAEKLLQYVKVFCIVNTRKDAQEVYSRLSKEGNV